MLNFAILYYTLNQYDLREIIEQQTFSIQVTAGRVYRSHERIEATLGIKKLREFCFVCDVDQITLVSVKLLK